jgi:hypothetical protein
MADYSKSKIYKITSPNTEKVYIGSTVRALVHRFSSHCHRYSTTRANEIISLGEAKIELVEEYPCRTKKELHSREYDIIRQTPNVINYLGTKVKS